MNLGKTKEFFGPNPEPISGYNRKRAKFGTLAVPNPMAGFPRTAIGTFRLKGCQRERVQRLARICRCLDRGRAQGKPFQKMLRIHARRWKNRHYKADPSRPIRFAYTTLRRIYYQWKHGGRTPAAIVAHYGANRKLPASQVLELARLCAAAGVCSFRVAWLQVENPTATHHAFWKAIPPILRKQLAALCAARRKVNYLERVAARTIEQFEDSIYTK